MINWVGQKPALLLLPTINKPHSDRELDAGGGDAFGNARNIDRCKLPTTFKVFVFADAVQTAGERERDVKRSAVEYAVAHAER